MKIKRNITPRAGGSHVLNLIIEGKEFEWQEQYITGTDLKKLAGLSSKDEIYLSLRDPYDDELVENDGKVNLARPGIEYFYIRQKLKFKINGKSYEWDSQYISGWQLRKLGNMSDEDELYLSINGPYEDELIEEDTIVNLARPGVEQFVSKARKIKLIVNSREKEWLKNTITFREVVILAFGEFIENPLVVYTVTYSKGPKENRQGSMVKGDAVYVKNKMNFNVTKTDKS